MLVFGSCFLESFFMNLKDVFCQDRPIASLQRAFAASRLGHAYIFAGANGIGKFTTAKAWAKMLLCEQKAHSETPNGGFYDSCGQCNSCKLFDGNSHPDYKVIYKELLEFTKKGKGKTSPVDLPKDVINEFLIEKVSSQPKNSDYVVYVIKESERLNAASQNALLKVLEEPPAYCIIILLCSSMEKMLPTTRSRCQTIRFGEIDENRIIEKLVEMSIGVEQAKFWARFSESSLGTAIEWATVEIDGNSIYDIKSRLISSIATQSLADSLDIADSMSEAVKLIAQGFSARNKNISKTDINRRSAKGLIRMIISAFSDVIRLEISGRDSLINTDQSSEIEKLAERFTTEEAADRVDKAYENLRWVDASVNEKLIFEELLLNLA